MSYFIIGGTNVLFDYRWDKCLILLKVGQMSYFIIGGTNVAVGQMSGGRNVGGRNVCGTYVCRTKIAPPF